MGLASAVEKSWYRKGGWTLLLLPLAWLFTVIARRRFSRRRVTPSDKLPVVVVGNITVGGTGKTPLIISLVMHLRDEGFKPGVISRGYGGSAPAYPYSVAPTSPAVESGDEPLLIARYCPVVVDPDRARAAEYLAEHSDVDVILSDDGMQHYDLPRDLEILVVDGARRFGNEQCLPAGPLREPLSRLSTVDWVLVNGAARTDIAAAEFHESGVETVPIKVVPSGFRLLSSEASGDERPPMGSVHGVAGIGNPRRFADSLEQLGYQVTLHPLADHHRFTGEELKFNDNLPVIVTAKDAVKLTPDILSGATADIWALDVEAQVDRAFLQDFCARIRAIQKAKTQR
ncbi:MAG: tetraacyldisaccharide 4'-kinase [bacterium]